MFNDDDESVVPLSRGRFQALTSDEELARGELPTQVDRESSVFDMTVADSPDEDEDRVVPPVDVPRGRRVVLIPQSGTPRSVHNLSDEGSNSEARMNGSDTDSLDVLEDKGSVVSGVEEPPPIEGTPAGFREAMQAIDEVNLDVGVPEEGQCDKVSGKHSCCCPDCCFIGSAEARLGRRS